MTQKVSDDSMCPQCGSSKKDVYILGCLPRHKWHYEPEAPKQNAVKSETVSPAREWLTDNFYFDEDDFPTLVSRRAFKANLETPLDEVLTAYASYVSSLSSQAIAAAAKDAAEKVTAKLVKMLADEHKSGYNTSKSFRDAFLPIISAELEKARTK